MTRNVIAHFIKVAGRPPTGEELAFFEAAMATQPERELSERQVEARIADLVAHPQMHLAVLFEVVKRDMWNGLEASRETALRYASREMGLDYPISKNLELTGKSVDRTRAEVSDHIACALLDIRDPINCEKRRWNSTLVVEAELEDGAFFVRFVAPPRNEQLVWTCASGYDAQPGIHRTTAEERSRLISLGFSDGERGNHERRVGVTGPTTARRVAESTLELLERTMRWSPLARMAMSTSHG